MSTRILAAGAIIIAIIALVSYFIFTRDDRGSTSDSYRLREFGLEITVPRELRDMQYIEQQGTLGQQLLMRSGDIESAGKSACDLGVFIKIPKDDIPTDSVWTTEHLMEARGEIGGKPAQVKEFTDFYLVFEPSEAVCATGNNVGREQAERTALWQSLTSARYAQF